MAVVGNVFRATIAFRNENGTPADPDVVTLIVKNPQTATETPYIYGVAVEVKKASTGIYYMDVAPTAGGIWKVRGKGTTSGGAAVSADEDEITVDWSGMDTP